MEDGAVPVDVSLDVQDSDGIAAVFIGYQTSDGDEVVIASAEPPATAQLKGQDFHTDEE